MPTRERRLSLSYRLTFTAPFHCGTGLQAGLIDRLAYRTSAGFLALPGSTVKGVVRRSCENIAHLLAARAQHELQEPTPSLRIDSPHDEARALRDLHPAMTLLTRIFGSRARPGTLFFDDAELAPEWRDFFTPPDSQSDIHRFQAWQVEERTQVSMARLTGTARSGFLFTSEYGVREVAFDGCIYGSLDDHVIDGDTSSYALALLLSGVLAIDHVGAQRSTGFGQCRLEVPSLVVDGDVIDDLAGCLQCLDDIAYYALLSEEG